MRFVLAPLADFTDAPFRRMCSEGGADMCFTEMISAAGLAHGSMPTRMMMETMPGEGPVAVQFFGSSELDLAFAVKTLGDFPEGSFSEVNLNAGCPMQKVVRTGAGARLVEDPGAIYRLLKAMTENTGLPVTLKTRLGPRPGEPRIFEIVDAAERAGAKGVAVHARYTSQMHGGPVDLETLSEAVARSRIPVTGNGSVTDAASAAAMAATGVSAIMVGRAALAAPDVFLRLKGRGTAAATPAETALRHLGYIVDFRRLLAARHPGARLPDEDALAALKVRTHLFRYFSGRPGAAKLRKRASGVRTLAEAMEVLQSEDMAADAV